MEVVRDAGACPPHDSGSVVTIGAYDGVHLGHRAVLDHVRRRAGSSGLSSAVVTFDRHPASVVRPESAPRLLTDPDQPPELLAATGITRCLPIAFDEAPSHEPAHDSVPAVHAGSPGAKPLLVCEDFHI